MGPVDKISISTGQSLFHEASLFLLKVQQTVQPTAVQVFRYMNFKRYFIFRLKYFIPALIYSRSSHEANCISFYLKDPTIVTALY